MFVPQRSFGYASFLLFGRKGSVKIRMPLDRCDDGRMAYNRPVRFVSQALGVLTLLRFFLSRTNGSSSRAWSCKQMTNVI